MADSNITIVGLQAIGGASQIVLSWAAEDPNAYGLPPLKYRRTEVRYSLSADMADAARVGFATTALVDVPVPRGQRRYYQARAIDQSDQEGEWCDPVSATEISGDVAISIAEQGFWSLPSDLVFEWGTTLFDASGYVTANLQRIKVPLFYGGFVLNTLGSDVVWSVHLFGAQLNMDESVSVIMRVMTALDGVTEPAGPPLSRYVRWVAIGSK